MWPWYVIVVISIAVAGIVTAVVLVIRRHRSGGVSGLPMGLSSGNPSCNPNVIRTTYPDGSETFYPASWRGSDDSGGSLDI